MEKEIREIEVLLRNCPKLEKDLLANKVVVYFLQESFHNEDEDEVSDKEMYWILTKDNLIRLNVFKSSDNIKVETKTYFRKNIKCIYRHHEIKKTYLMDTIEQLTHIIIDFSDETKLTLNTPKESYEQKRFLELVRQLG